MRRRTTAAGAKSQERRSGRTAWKPPKEFRLAHISTAAMGWRPGATPYQWHDGLCGISISKRSVRAPGRGIKWANQTLSRPGIGNRESRDELANTRLHRPSHQEPGGLDGLRRTV